MSELLARVETWRAAPPGRAKSTCCRWPTCSSTCAPCASRARARTINLQPREFRLLEYLMRHEGQIVTRTMLLEGVWEYHFDPQTNVIDVQISRLRSKIDKDFDPPLIHTVRGAGYVLSATGYGPARTDAHGRPEAMSSACAARSRPGWRSATALLVALAIAALSAIVLLRHRRRVRALDRQQDPGHRRAPGRAPGATTAMPACVREIDAAAARPDRQRHRTGRPARRRRPRRWPATCRAGTATAAAGRAGVRDHDARGGAPVSVRLLALPLDGGQPAGGRARPDRTRRASASVVERALLISAARVAAAGLRRRPAVPRA